MYSKGEDTFRISALLPEVSYNRSCTHQISKDNKQKSSFQNIQGFCTNMEKTTESESECYKRSFSLWRQEEKNSVRLLREARSCFECIMWNFSLMHSLQVLELGL